MRRSYTITDETVSQLPTGFKLNSWIIKSYRYDVQTISNVYQVDSEDEQVHRLFERLACGDIEGALNC